MIVARSFAVEDVLHPYATAHLSAPDGHATHLAACVEDLGTSDPAARALDDLGFVFLIARTKLKFDGWAAGVLLDTAREFSMPTPVDTPAFPFFVWLLLKRMTEAGSKEAEQLTTKLSRLTDIERLVLVRLAQSALALETGEKMSRCDALRAVGLMKA